MGLPNIQHSDKWTVIFSNIPGYHPLPNDNSEGLSLYDLYVKELTFPSLSLELVESKFRNFEIRHQISKINDTLNDLEITFKLSEGMMNYYHIYDWMQSMREMINVDDEKWFRLNMIKEIKILFLDNEKRPKVKHIYKNSFIIGLTSLNLTNGVDDELTFTVTVKYEDYSVELVTEC